MFCKDCGSQLPDRYKFCEVCGAETDSLISENGINNLYLSSVKRKKKPKIKAIIFTALIIAIGISVFFVNYTKKRAVYIIILLGELQGENWQNAEG